MGSGSPHIGVSVYQGGSFPHDTSIYRIQVAKRGRSKAGDGTGVSGNISYGRMCHGSGFLSCPAGVSISNGGSVSSDTSNYRMPMAKRARSKAETGTGMPGRIS